MKKIALLLVLAIAFAGCGQAADEPVAVLDCFDGMNEYQVDGTPIQFCYDPAWGEPVIAETAGTTGSLFELSFPNSPNGPILSYQSVDYGGFDFEGLNLYTTDENVNTELAEQLGLMESNFIARKADVGTQRAIRVHFNYGQINEVVYYVPNAFEGYHMELSADYEAATELDNFMFDMIL